MDDNMSTLLEECIEALTSSIEMFNELESKSLRNNFESKIKFNNYGIDWGCYESKIDIQEASEILNLIPNGKCFILWDEYSKPVIKSNLNNIINNIYDVTAVSFDTYLIDYNFNWVIEFHHEEKIRIAFLCNIPNGTFDKKYN